MKDNWIQEALNKPHVLEYSYSTRDGQRMFHLDLFWQPYIHLNIDRQARALLNSSDNKLAANEAITILNLIQEQLMLYDTADLPAITAFTLDNGSLGLEWVIGRFRVGFNFEMDSKESGYFLISDRSAGEIRSYGYLQGLNRRSLVKSLLTLILER